jgi:hypothetical protein
MSGSIEHVGFANSSGVVFVGESAEEVAAAGAVRGLQGCWVAAVGWEEVERTVRPCSL